MKNKKIILIIVCIIILLIGGFSLYRFLTKEDKNTSLNVFEKQWIENNKNNLIDMSIINDIPILSHNGEGIILDFLDDLNKNTSLSFNKVSYNLNDEVKTPYSFKAVDNLSSNDILIYTDNYVVLTKNKTYVDVKDLENFNIGVLYNDLEKINNYLFHAKAFYKTYHTKDELIAELNKQNSKLDAIILPKTTYLKDIIENNYKIAHNISDYKKYYVLSLGDNERLNDILTKYYKRWSLENYDDSYNKNLSKKYLSFMQISDADAVKFRSKRYVYGFIENAPFDTLTDGKLSGINNSLLSGFSKLTNAEITYKKYNSLKELVEAFNKNEIDLFYSINEVSNYNLDTYKTSPVYDNNMVILKHASNDLVIHSVKSLSEVYTLENSDLAFYLGSNGISLKKYSNMKDLMNDINENSIIVLDLLNYNYYKSKLKDYIVDYEFEINNYSFISRSISDNKIFNEFLDFYILFNDNKIFINEGLSNLLLIDKTPIILKNLAIILGGIVGLLLVVLAILKIKPKKNKVNFSKEDKLRYIDALTSLKNRNYLNDSIENWDNSEIYPQTIVIVDLNNIAYINDNYGHAEGDEVISQAANILILNQIENTEIIRTNGNEFLIYLVGYEEKQVITYIRKLNKELKELKHGFGAAIGYSVINDAIKTIDDAINEATIDMRNNKEETTKE